MNTVTCYDSTGKLLEELCQWDINVTVQVGGADTTSAPNIHFCQKGRECAYVVPSQIKGDKLEAKIPNILLQSHYPIVAFLYYKKDSGEQRSMYQVLIPIIPRDIPMEYVYTENIGYESWTQMTEEAKQIIDASEDLMEKYAAAQQLLQQTQTYATQAAASQKEAADSAKTAKQYSGNPAKPQDGTWWIWNAESSKYTDTGEKTCLRIDVSYASVAAMNADAANQPNNTVAIIASSVDQEDNAKLYIKNSAGWLFLADLSGFTGVGIQSWEKISGTGGSGATDTYRITLTDKRTFEYKVYNGKDAVVKMSVTDDGAGNVTVTF